MDAANDNERAEARKRIADKAAAEKKAMHAERRRLYVRGQYGKDWDGKADNDNVAWPLATALVREGNSDLLKVAMAYRRTYDAAKSEATLGGKSVALRDGFALDRHTHIRANGTIAYKHVRQSTAASVDIPATQKVVPFANEDDGVERNAVRVPKPWAGDKPVNDMIDAQEKLAAMHKALGALLEPLEMSVIDGATYQAIGNFVGVADRSGSIAAGRAVIHLALIALRDSMGKITKEDLVA